jgi:hypothetical protein
MGGHKKRKGLKTRRPGYNSEEKERDSDTIRAINQILDSDPVRDLHTSSFPDARDGAIVRDRDTLCFFTPHFS